MKFLLALFVGGLAACAPPEPIRPGNVAAGKKIYTTYCAACHQKDGTGTTPQGVRLAANYTLADGPLARSDEELLRIIHEGRTGPIGSMPPWRGILSPQDQHDVLAYLRAEFTAD